MKPEQSNGMTSAEGMAPPEEIVAQIRERARVAKTIVFVSGNFNVVHPGHLRLLQFAADCGDFLVVGVNGRHSRGADLPEDMRLEGVRAISVVDFAFLLHETPERFITLLQPAVVVKGKEFEERDNAEKAAVDGYGGKLLFSSGEVRFSSLDLLRREYSEANFSTIHKPKEFAQRHGFSLDELKAALRKLSGLRVLVIGDLIVDEYITCDPLGMSQEDPTIVVTPIEQRRFIGGAAIVAAHAKGLGADVQYLSVCGVDETADFARESLERYGVAARLIADTSRPTTLKQRYRAAGKTLLRVSHLRQHDIARELIDAMLKQALNEIARADLVIFADFNYGCLPQELVDRIVEKGTQRNVMMVGDSQASSQMSDVSRFKNMTLLTPTEREARLALRDFNSGLVVIAESLARVARARNVVVTLGQEGLLASAHGGAQPITDRLPAFNTAPRDPAGAGDSLLACASMALCAGLDIWKAIYLGSLAAACQVSRVGNTPLSQQDLLTEIDLP